jgi:hypothetical protein
LVPADGCILGPWEEEPSNSHQEAIGLPLSGRTYHGYPNGPRDYFSIKAYYSGQITVDLTHQTGRQERLLGRGMAAFALKLLRLHVVQCTGDTTVSSHQLRL